MNYRLPEVFIIQFTFSFQRERQNCLGATRLFLFTCLRSGCFLSILSTALEQSKVLSFGHSLILFYLFTSIPILLYYIILSLIPLSYLVDQLFPLAHSHCFFLSRPISLPFLFFPSPFLRAWYCGSLCHITELGQTRHITAALTYYSKDKALQFCLIS